MHLTFDNVNDAFNGMVRGFQLGSEPGGVDQGGFNVVRKSSRNGPVLMIDEPVIITYRSPTRRVLFNAARDASPFLHLYESLYHLAGRNDVAPLAYYTPRFKDYSDDGETLNDAYGYRWRGQDYTHRENIPPCPEYPHGLETGEARRLDQLDLIVEHLRANPESRRAVLQMWNTTDDLLKITGTPATAGRRDPCPQCRGRGELPPGGTDRRGYDLGGGTCGVCHGAGDVWTEHPRPAVPASKSVCCNTSVMFSLRPAEYDPEEAYSPNTAPPGRAKLDALVTNRSNDLIWGALGANWVTFTILLEYMAARLGADVGRYSVVSNDLHVYEGTGGGATSGFRPREWLADQTPNYYVDFNVSGLPEAAELWGKHFTVVPLVEDPARFEEELGPFVEYHKDGGGATNAPRFTEPFLHDVAHPALRAFHLHKIGNREGARLWAEKIVADDWRLACTAWLERRRKK